MRRRHRLLILSIGERGIGERCASERASEAQRVWEA
jgi:hypothetical protein